MIKTVICTNLNFSTLQPNFPCPPLVTSSMSQRLFFSFSKKQMTTCFSEELVSRGSVGECSFGESRSHIVMFMIY